ncbi:MAG: ERF family protein [Mariprofundaceae bacterium]|nr:ERF family protein [Mariprofundaceae bacterium]
MSDMYKDFIKAQSEFEKASKDAKNPHFKSKYADLASCIEAVKSALNSNNFALLQLTKECESGVSVNTVFLHASGEKIEGGALYIPASTGGRNDAHAFGSALTYARRYSLLAAAGIAPEDDDGNAAAAGQPQTQQQPSVNMNALSDSIKSAMTLHELKTAWEAVPKAHQPKLEALKNSKKEELPA